LMMLDPNQNSRKVEFSRILGTHATFIVDGDDVTPYGKDVEDTNSTNFFGA